MQELIEQLKQLIVAAQDKTAALEKKEADLNARSGRISDWERELVSRLDAIKKGEESLKFRLAEVSNVENIVAIQKQNAADHAQVLKERGALSDEREKFTRFSNEQKMLIQDGINANLKEVERLKQKEAKLLDEVKAKVAKTFGANPSNL